MLRVLKMLTLCLCALTLCLAGATARAADAVTDDGMVEVEAWDTQAAFAGYVERAFSMDTWEYRTPKGASANTAVSLLSPEGKAAYDILVPLIRQVADGERASTGFDISAAGMNKDERRLLFQALLADLPYEMYWAGFGFNTGSIGDTAVTFYITVGPGYQPADYDSSDPKVDTAKTGATRQALENANALAAAARELRGNYAKLNFIKETICDLVDYNYDALEPGYIAMHTDPWQIIYVFDGDPATDVVCEGYAKAFQYLCDNAELNGAISYYVDGVFAFFDVEEGGYVGGDHAWNVVRLANGCTYLVDLTHVDAAFVTVTPDEGEILHHYFDSRRFLAGGIGDAQSQYEITLPYMELDVDGGLYAFEEEIVYYLYSDETKQLWSEDVLTLNGTSFDLENDAHAWDEGTITLEPTCTTDGSREYTCLDCGAVVTETIAAGHEWVVQDGQEPTCTKGGWESYNVCFRCGEIESYTELDPLGHDLTWHEGRKPTCTEGGWSDYETCSRCDHTTYAELDPLGHDLTQHEAKTPTATEAGWEAYETCSRCDYSTYVELPALGPTALRGDFNDDGKVNAKDVVLLQRHVAGGYGIELDAELTDLNRDGKVNAKDVVLLQRYVAGGYGVTLQ